MDLETDSVSECGKIYRNLNGTFCFVCAHCGDYFENINDTLEHINIHFSDRTGDNATEEIMTSMDGVDTLEFISITTDVRIEPNVEDDHRKQSAFDSFIDTPSSEDFETNSIEGRKQFISCSYCSESFPSRLLLVLHSEISHHMLPIEGIQSSNTQCDVCLIEYDSPAKLEEHLNRDHCLVDEITNVTADSIGAVVPETSECLECNVCRRSFKAKHLLNRHLQRSTCKNEFCVPTHVGEFPFYCDICGSGFPYKFRLIQHMNRRHTAKKLTKHEKQECLQRPNSNRNEKTIGDELQVEESLRENGEPKNVQAPKMFSCEFCNKVYDTQYKLKQHLLAHSNLKEFKCDQCDCAYNTKPRLRRHYIYKHTDHPTFDCEVCGWKFREKNNLKRHMRLHNGDYQAQCQICHKQFTANCHLKYHMNTAHSTETPYQCDLCGKSFNTTSKMNAHRRRHIKETLPCDVCGKVFASRGRLYTHKKTHSEERNIICKVCGKNFKTAVVLRQHMYLHKGKIFSCNFCPMTFAQSSGRRTHEKLRHNIL